MTEKASSAHKRVTIKLLVVVVAMFGFGFALVPVYRVICDITGLGNNMQSAQSRAVVEEVDRDRLVTVEFVATVNSRAGWEFRPTQTKMQVHPGELYTTTYYAANRQDQPAVAQASYNVVPIQAARYMAKPDCFCFSRQPFDALEAREMPVTFFIDPDLPPEVKTVTFSYTFFDVTEDS